MTFAIHTLGCKVNHFESFQISEALRKAGWKDLGTTSTEDPDIIVLNTCAVTSRASYQSRQSFRRLKKTFPKARIVVTGCDASYEGNRYLEEGAYLVVPQDRKEHILKFILGKEKVLPYPPPMPGRSRAYLKIEDGCNRFCHYCIIPRLRGGIRSVPEEKVRNGLIKLLNMGYREIVIVGINLGAYGLDIYGKPRLQELLEMLMKEVEGRGRLRLSSIEPDMLPINMVNLMDGERLCRHIHLPLQGTTDRILKDMGRKYTIAEFTEVTLKIKEADELITVGTDVIVGYPGEDDGTFEEGMNNLLRMGLDYGHVFPYSKRKGTPSPNGTVKGIKERARILREFFEKKRIEHMKKCLSKVFTVVVEKGFSGITDNYMKVKLLHKAKEGDVERVLIKDILQEKYLLGVPV